MPKKGGAANAKTAQKKVQKIVEDKTFGMKNKNKSKKVQNFVAQVKKQTESKVNKGRPATAEPPKSKKQLKAEKDAEYNAIFKPVTQAAPKHGVDPKSVICQFFKQGSCTKGAKCKFSHDLSVERKSEKIDIYTDRRDAPTDAEEGTMEDWDEQKLRSVVERRGGDPPNKTEIVCKYFIEAVESKKYGWFWECPNGGTSCKYRHALPPDFVFKVKKSAEPEDDEDKPDIGDLLEVERRNLKQGTPVTLELFLAWKEKKRLAREKEQEGRKKDIEAGKVAMSGRELFEANPDLIAGDDEGAADSTELEEDMRLKEEEEMKGMTPPAVVVDENLFAGDDVGDLPDFDDETGEAASAEQGEENKTEKEAPTEEPAATQAS